MELAITDAITDLAKIMENFSKGDLVFSIMEVDTGDPPTPIPPQTKYGKFQFLLKLPLKYYH